MTEYIPPFDDDSNDADDAVYQTEFDPITDRVSEELLKAVATLNDADPTELTVLSEFVDPEALDALFGPRASKDPRDSNGHILFNYDSYYVKVESDGQITFHQPMSESNTDHALIEDD
ncbi:hypothetical protein SAMN05421858_4617 [Haladaptatus litoreus]|uniref:Halobacterial output domain-containing protein n=1 Tax=Haladaptatus litoreus TaxID=553468 RepID=A0A1N7EXZ8_9EURY|nr:HalOD1 output domain-containing protein [Haladaptatus litoreus]SIR92934.1 hypothetical protein SAMN05421858_4617 [Haladaptatus litoreus]